MQKEVWDFLLSERTVQLLLSIGWQKNCLFVLYDFIVYKMMLLSEGTETSEFQV